MRCRRVATGTSFKSCPREGASTPFTPSTIPLKSFKSCPREGASWCYGFWRYFCRCFKSCPREGASGQCWACLFERSDVSSHAPVRGHPAARWRCSWPSPVSSHAPVRGHQIVNIFLSSLFQVSSHAPVRGHQKCPVYADNRGSFKSCPREGASCFPAWLQFCVLCFKSCPREGASAKLYKKADPYCIVHR